MLGHPTPPKTAIETPQTNPTVPLEVEIPGTDVSELPQEFSLFFQQDAVEEYRLDLVVDGLAGGAEDSESALGQTGLFPNLTHALATSEFEGFGNSETAGRQIEFVQPTSNGDLDSANAAQLATLNTDVRADSNLQPTISATASDSNATSIAQQAIHALKSEFVSFQQAPNQSITIEINPPELGRINIQVEVAADQISAQIVATEWVSAELLSRQKSQLVNSLSEFGYSEANVDISHGSLDDRSNDNPEGDPNGDPSDWEFFETKTIEQDGGRQSNSVVMVGVNLVI